MNSVPHDRPTLPGFLASTVPAAGYRCSSQYARFEAAIAHLQAAFDIMREAARYEEHNIDLDVDLSDDIEEMTGYIGAARDEVQCRGIENVATHAAMEGGEEHING